VSGGVGGEGGRGEWWVLAHPVACLSTLSEIMCCGYTGVTALRPDVGGGLRTYVRASALLFSLATAAALYLPPSFLPGQRGSAPLYFRTSVHFYKSSDVPRRVPPSHSHASRHRIRLAVSYNASEERARGRKRGGARRAGLFLSGT